MKRSARVGWGGALLLALGSPGCKPPGREADRFGEAIAAADLVWERRAEAGTLDDAERAYTALLAERPQAGAVLWRLSRMAWSRAMMEPARALRWHEVGREYALRCVGSTTAVAAVTQSLGDRLSPPVPVGAAPLGCRVYGGAHVLGLVRARGPGSDLDLEDAEPLLAGLDETVEPAVGGWAAGTLRVLQGRDSAAARDALLSAVAAAPGVAFYRREALSAFPDVDGSLPRFTPDPAWALENADP